MTDTRSVLPTSVTDGIAVDLAPRIRALLGATVTILTDVHAEGTAHDAIDAIAAVGAVTAAVERRMARGVPRRPLAYSAQVVPAAGLHRWHVEWSYA